MKKRLKILIPILLLIAGASVGFEVFRGEGPKDRLIVSGNIEVTEVPLAFRIPGRLKVRLLDEGEMVKAGQPVAVLDSTDQELTVAKARAELQQARAMLSELENGSRPEEIARSKAAMEQARFGLQELENGSRFQEIADAAARLDQALAAAKAAQSEFELASRDDERYAALYRDGGVSRQEYDRVRTRFETSQNAHTEAQARVQSSREYLSLRREGPRREQVEMARSAFQKAEAEYALVEKGPRQEVIDQARAAVATAEEGLRLAEQQLSYTTLTAPFDGVILSKSAEPGAYLNPGTPVVTLASLDRVWLRAYINETDLSRVRLNQDATLTTDTYSDRTWQGRLAFVGSDAEFTPKTVQTFEERVQLMYRIKIDVENPDHALKPGMPADAEIKVGS